MFASSTDAIDPISHLWQLADTAGLLDACISDRIIASFDMGFNVHFHSEERFFRQKVLFVVIDHIGCAFFDDWPIGNPARFVGTKRKDWIAFPLPVQVAILDSLFYRQSWGANVSIDEKLIRGVPLEKGLQRTRLICREVERVCRDIPRQRVRPRVGLIGVSRLQAKLLAEVGFEISAWDLDAAYIGHNILPGVTVSMPDKMHTKMAEIDVLLISGMTIANGSLLPLLLEAQAQGKKSLVWAVTGANIAPLFHKWGLDVAICEHFPQYFFPGDTRIEISRANR